MSLAPAGASEYMPSPYEVGASDYTQAQSGLDQLSALSVTQNDYKSGNHGLIDQQIKLEDEIAQHVSHIAEANERGQVSSSLLTHTQSLYKELQSRLAQDDQNASDADLFGSKPLSMTAYTRDHDSGLLQDALMKGNAPDVISLGDTSSFMDKVNALDLKIKTDLNNYNNTKGATHDDAEAQLVGPDSEQLTDFINMVHQQAGYEGSLGGIIGPKLESLQGDDPQKRAYINQSDQLLRLVSADGGTLFQDSALLAPISGN